MINSKVKMSSEHDVSELMIKKSATAFFIVSAIIASLSSVSHYLMGIMIAIPIIEFIQLIVGIFFFALAYKTKNYNKYFQYHLTCDFFGLSLPMIIGGSMFLTNTFWVALISPILLILGSKYIAYGLFSISIIQIIGLFIYSNPDSSSRDAVILFDGLLYALTIGVFVSMLKYWQDNLRVIAKVSESGLLEFQTRKSNHLTRINHELRNPLTAMLASIEMLGSIKLDKTNTEKFNESVIDQQKYIKSITFTSKHITSILNDVLAIEKIESEKLSVKKSWFSVSTLVNNVGEMFTAQLLAVNSNLNIIYNNTANIKWLGAQTEIRQVLINLISNSIRHAPGSLITVAINEDGDVLRISIKDNGPGLSKTEIVNVFNTEDSKLASDGSSGLGLTICKSLIEDYIGGKITVSSKEGVGTEFSIELFLTKYNRESDADLMPANLVTKENLLNACEGKRLLLVDDSVDVLDAISAGLKRLGFTTVCASTSQEAMNLIQAGNTFDAALIDFNLGSGSTNDGIELSVELIKAGLEKVIGYTGNDSPEISEKWTKAGAKLILHKPLSISDVANNIMTLH